MPKKLQRAKLRLCPICHDETKDLTSDDHLLRHLLQSHGACRVWTCNFRSSKDGFFSATGGSCKHGVKFDSAADATDHIRQIHIRPNMMKKGFDASIFGHKNDSVFKDRPDGLTVQQWPSLDILMQYLELTMDYHYSEHSVRWLMASDPGWGNVFRSLPMRRETEQRPEPSATLETPAQPSSQSESPSMYIVRTISEDRSGDNAAVSASILAALGEREKPTRIYDPGARLENVSLAYLGGR